MNNGATLWITRLGRARASERLRLLCFPYAGGGAHIYADWQEALPPEVGVHAVQLPGRGRRFGEPPLERLDLMVAGIVDELHAVKDAPFVFFGHSMGALLAFETTRTLRRLGQTGPLRLLVSGYRSPQLEREQPPIHGLPDDGFVAKLREFEGTPAEVFQNQELLQLMLPTVRADFAAVETHSYQSEPPLSCPITAFGGLSDGHFGRDAVAAWSSQTTGEFKLHLLEGSHFFIHSARDALLRLVAAELERLIATGAPPRHATA